MLFNTYKFIFIFLPIVLIGYYFITSRGWHRSATFWLVVMSCVFYASFKLRYLVYLFILLVFNYWYGMLLSKFHRENKAKLSMLFGGIAVNLAVLIYYKYTHFFLENINSFFHTSYTFKNIILPIGISFFIFQKIAYLVDCYEGTADEYNFLDFCLFVLYFPQLVAGPIVHHHELIPQFKQKNYIHKYDNIAIGLFVFTIGLCKKALFADPIATMVDPCFSAAATWNLSFFEAWFAAIGFTLQIYFDFSAYTDMALGISKMLGIELPLNFDSPYKSTSIIDFWRRWHMSLSRFLQRYVYVPLGGNRKGTLRRYLNLMLTMLIGGFWHGAAWTFIFWGAFHGLLLTINHAWRSFKVYFKIGTATKSYHQAVSRGVTFLMVMFGWVLFRANGMQTAINLFKGMFGFHGVVLSARYEQAVGIHKFILKDLGIQFNDVGVAYIAGSGGLILFACLLVVIWFLPNTQQWCSYIKQPRLEQKQGISNIRSNISGLILSPAMGLMLAFAVFGTLMYQMSRTTVVHNFIYFQF